MPRSVQHRLCINCISRDLGFIVAMAAAPAPASSLNTFGGGGLFGGGSSTISFGAAPPALEPAAAPAAPAAAAAAAAPAAVAAASPAAADAPATTATDVPAAAVSMAANLAHALGILSRGNAANTAEIVSAGCSLGMLIPRNGWMTTNARTVRLKTRASLCVSAHRIRHICAQRSVR
jgi:hypothetical protein